MNSGNDFYINHPIETYSETKASEVIFRSPQEEATRLTKDDRRLLFDTIDEWTRINLPFSVSIHWVTIEDNKSKLRRWLNKNCLQRWTFNYRGVSFEEENDALKFKMFHG